MTEPMTKNALLGKIPYLSVLSRGLGLNNAPWRHSLDNIGESVPDTHCDSGRIHNGEWWFRLRCRSSIRRFVVPNRKRSEALGQGHEMKTDPELRHFDWLYEAGFVIYDHVIFT